MVGRDTKRTLREMHGGDVEIIELDGEDAPTGKRYVVQRKDPMAGWPLWLRIPAALLFLVVGAAALAGCLYLIVFGVWIVWSGLH